MLLKKMLRIHLSSSADILPYFAISVRAPQNCSNDSLYLCFLFNSLCISNVTLIFLMNAIDRFSQNSLKEICSILTRVNF